LLANAGRRDNYGFSFMDFGDGTAIKVIIMIMGDQDNIRRRSAFDPERVDINFFLAGNSERRMSQPDYIFQ
jgi:hypothetical protein